MAGPSTASFANCAKYFAQYGQFCGSWLEDQGHLVARNDNKTVSVTRCLW